MRNNLISASFMAICTFASGCSAMTTPEYGIVTTGLSLKASLSGASIVAVVERLGAVTSLLDEDGKVCATVARFRVLEAFKGNEVEFDVVAEHASDLSNEHDRFLLIGFRMEPDRKSRCMGVSRDGPAFYLTPYAQTIFPLEYDPNDTTTSFLLAYRDSVFTPAPLFGAVPPILRLGADAQRIYAYLLWSDVEGLLEQQLESRKQ